tara:strand:- start:36 stop:275 length:240 start_codon:yes stop_codon:yes gene_type:complete
MVEQVLQQKLQQVQLLMQVEVVEQVDPLALLHLEQVEQVVVEMEHHTQVQTQEEMEQSILVVEVVEHQLTQVVGQVDLV